MNLELHRSNFSHCWKRFAQVARYRWVRLTALPPQVPARLSIPRGCRRRWLARFNDRFAVRSV